MRIVDDHVLECFRGPGICDWCGAICQNLEAAHVHSKGAGRLDVRFNLCSLGGAFECGCHAKHHSGQQPKRVQLVKMVAKRERTTPEAVVNAVNFLRGWPKDVEITRKRCKEWGLRGKAVELVMSVKESVK